MRFIGVVFSMRPYAGFLTVHRLAVSISVRHIAGDFSVLFNPCLHRALFRRGLSVSFLAVDFSVLPFAGVYAVVSFAVHFPLALS